MRKRELEAENFRLREEMWQLRYENARLQYRLDGSATTGFPSFDEWHPAAFYAQFLDAEPSDRHP